MPAKHYNDKPVADWSVNDMLRYLADEHMRRYNVEYQPSGTWAAERGMLGGWIGTRNKAGKYGAEFTKRFIDLCLAEWRPNGQYRGVSFGFMAGYMKRNIQRVQVEQLREDAAAGDEVSEIDDDWL